MNISFAIIISVLLLNECAASTSTQDPLNKKQIMSFSSKSSLSRIAECEDEMNTLKKTDPQAFNHYQAEFDRIHDETESFLDLELSRMDKNHYLALPKYQSSLQNICFRINHHASISIRKQV